jgi:hypothetical protein
MTTGTPTLVLFTIVARTIANRITCRAFWLIVGSLPFLDNFGLR